MKKVLIIYVYEKLNSDQLHIGREVMMIRDGYPTFDELINAERDLSRRSHHFNAKIINIIPLEE